MEHLITCTGADCERCDELLEPEHPQQEQEPPVEPIWSGLAVEPIWSGLGWRAR